MRNNSRKLHDLATHNSQLAFGKNVCVYVCMFCQPLVRKPRSYEEKKSFVQEKCLIIKKCLLGVGIEGGSEEEGDVGPLFNGTQPSWVIWYESHPCRSLAIQPIADGDKEVYIFSQGALIRK